MVFGVKSAMTFGQAVMPELFVESWDSLLMVISHCEVHAIQLCDAIGAIKKSSNYQQPALEYFLSAANCAGSEETIFSCGYSRPNFDTPCTSDAGLICQGICISCRFFVQCC